MNSDTGPFGYRNWKAFSPDTRHVAMFELPFYSDAELISEPAHFRCGPYVIMPVQNYGAPDLRPALVARVQWHIQPQPHPSKQTNHQHYHGGHFPDELTAILSLLLGVRLKSGNMTREFSESHPFGRPLADVHRPSLAPCRHPQATIIPSAKKGTLGSEEIELLKLYPRLSARHASVLVRAAGAYRDGLWLAESDPELAWLLFVAAVEAAAVDHQINVSDPAALLTRARSELVSDLVAKGDTAALSVVAKHLFDELQVTERFAAFLVEFGPKEKNSDTESPIDWGGLGTLVRKVYSYRSRALHQAKPFPPPMCEPPRCSNEAPEDGWSSATATFARVDLPMLLHTFERITRTALVNWFKASARAAKSVDHE